MSLVCFILFLNICKRAELLILEVFLTSRQSLTVLLMNS